jgi:hypothetical protein
MDELFSISLFLTYFCFYSKDEEEFSSWLPGTGVSSAVHRFRTIQEIFLLGIHKNERCQYNMSCPKRVQYNS